MKTTAIVLAAGSGSRMKSAVKKQYLEVDTKPLVYYALRAFEDSVADDIVLVVSPGDSDYCREEIVDKYSFSKVRKITEGGSERYDSVCEGLRACSPDTDYVFIHDGARPFVTDDIIRRCLDEAQVHKAAVAAMPVKDTIKIADFQGFAESTPDRSRLWQIQTPQTFEYPLIRRLYEKLEAEKEVLIAHGLHVTDDAMVVETFSDVKVKLVEGSYENIKITTPDDIQSAEAILAKRKSGQ
jgi:2-C-methyl-D-erythritol 4-phosphate cytidylyltransferase